jgi:hypothetical protein
MASDVSGAAAMDISVSVLKLALDTGAAAATQLVEQLQPTSPRQPAPVGQLVDLYA